MNITKWNIKPCQSGLQIYVDISVVVTDNDTPATDDGNKKMLMKEWVQDYFH